MTLRRWLALLLGCVLAAGVVALHAALRRRAEEHAWLERRRSAEDSVRARARAGARPAFELVLAPEHPEQRTFFLTEEQAATLFPIHENGRRYDPWCYFRHKPRLNVVVDWPEHPSGRWTLATNAEGFREDADLDRSPHDLRVIVAGDSHAEGFCDNRDSFAARLEALLAAAHPAAKVDVLNAAEGGHTFQNYLGVMEELQALAPQVFVVAVHAGNDFREALLPEAYFRGKELAPMRARESAGLVRGMQISPAGMTQAFYSLLHFACERDREALALEVGLIAMERIERIARPRGIRVLVVLLPAPPDAGWPEMPAEFERLRESLELDASEVAVHVALGDRFLAGLASRGIEHLDARPLLARGGPYFWKRDFHLDLAGHCAVAEALLERLERPR